LLMKTSKREFVKVSKDSRVPLIGCLAFGYVDRGTNTLQVRPSSYCPLNCVFCSVNTGCKSNKARYLVDVDYMLDYARGISDFKDCELHWHIDTVGEALTYPDLPRLIAGLKELDNTLEISLETNGVLLTRDKIKELKQAGLDRINLSIHALNNELSKKLVGVDWYRVNHVLSMIDVIIKEGLSLVLAPVWVPGMNDEEIPKIIELAIKKIKKQSIPSLGVQKYEVHKHGRKVRTKEMSWAEFYARLRDWEKEYGVKLVLKPSDFGIRKAKRIPIVMKKGETISITGLVPGWEPNQVVGVCRERAVTVLNWRELGVELKCRVIHNKDNIYLARIKA